MGASLDSDTWEITTNKKSKKKNLFFLQKYIFSKALQLLLVTKRASANGTICQSRKKSTVLDFLRLVSRKLCKQMKMLAKLLLPFQLLFLVPLSFSWKICSRKRIKSP